MNYNQYDNPKATQASKMLAIVTYVIAIVGIIAFVVLMSSGVHSVWGLLIILVVFALVLLRPRIEAAIVARIVEKSE